MKEPIFKDMSIAFRSSLCFNQHEKEDDDDRGQSVGPIRFFIFHQEAGKYACRKKQL